MSEAREHILGTIRRGLKRGAVDGERRARLEERLASPPRNVVPARAQLAHDEQVQLFVRMAREAAATVESLPDREAVPGAVVELLRARELPLELVMAPDEAVAGLPWDRAPDLSVERRAARNGDRVSLTPAFAGIAETGTLMLLSGSASPTTLNLLPDVHVVVLEAADIVGPYEDAWDRLRARGQGMPRTVNLITGPSRSADIEQKLQMGAHGPVELIILLVGA